MSLDHLAKDELMADQTEPTHSPDSPTGVRQGTRAGVVWIVLTISLALAVIAMLLAYVFS